jgi:hypothetical protein
VEVSGITNPSSPPPNFTAFNGTWPMLGGPLLAGLSVSMARYAIFNFAVDYDSGYEGEYSVDDPAGGVDPEIRSFCLVHAELPGFDPDGSGVGNDNGLVVMALLYGTTGGGLSAVVMMWSGTNWFVYQNVVLSASARRIDCGTTDILANALAEVNWTGSAFNPHFDPTGVEIRITTV